MNWSVIANAMCVLAFTWGVSTEARSAPNDRLQIQQLIAELHVEPAQRARTLIANELAAFGGQAVPALRTLLDSPTWTVRSYTILAFGEMGAEAVQAVPDLLRIAKDPEDQLRLNVISALGRIGPVNSEVIDFLVRQVRDESLKSANVAYKSLCLMGTPVLPEVLKLFRELPAERQAWFTRYLGTHIGESSEAIEALDQLMVNANGHIAANAAMALARNPRGCQYLLTKLDDPNVSIRRYVVIALTQLDEDGQPYIVQLSAALADADANVRYLALKAVETIDAYPPDVLSRVVARVDDPDADVRWRAIEIVGQLENPPPEVVPMVEAKLDDDEPIVGIAAAVSLFRLTGNPERSLESLEKFGDEGSSTIGQALAQAFRQIESPETGSRRNPSMPADAGDPRH